MNKPGQGGGGAAATTAAAAAATIHRQRALLQRADADIANLIDNFAHMLKAARVNDPVRNAQENFQMDIHASRVVQAADSLLKLVSELKQNAVFSDFISLNECIAERAARFEEQNSDTERLLLSVGEELGASLVELETLYYKSLQRLSPAEHQAQE
ncbi:hypothetical protein SELMODRAFT_102574 [Selaginella moellendorffii]|uniref:Mediator of RNA polymerase II transcription subunit 22 n=1 Tax=Selaginella moellendorffii TaxID=88036 RepID=D8RVA1_SELML|nr:mediator of RNA polymerase II transcription subunit 22a [Selaginella moellendorffii]EFJ23739.1 hypothetical protein SELMODRAFT_102574 [Selaginella moellendorffii]|eukprot:XP_002974954.1 mediator of RNA polymerase II transcription subunit 22a [Selaginella moellendorffii]